jgi:DNA-binding XRE family transcriptional regulator
MAKKPGMNPVELKAARARLGFTQEQLAIELNVHRLSVIRWEIGTHRIPFMLNLAIKELERGHAP